MNKRTFLRYIIVGFSAIFSGCVGDVTTTEKNTKNKMKFDVIRIEEAEQGDVSIIKGGLSGNSDDRKYVTIVESEHDLDRFNIRQIKNIEESEDAVAFITDTNFQNNFLVIIQHLLPSSDLTLSVKEISGNNSTLNITIQIPRAGGGGVGQEALNPLIIKIYDGEKFAPSKVIVTVENDPYNDWSESEFKSG